MVGFLFLSVSFQQAVPTDKTASACNWVDVQPGGVKRVMKAAQQAARNGLKLTPPHTQRHTHTGSTAAFSSDGFSPATHVANALSSGATCRTNTFAE